MTALGAPSPHRAPMSEALRDPATGLSYAVLSNTTRGAWPLVKALDASFAELCTLAAQDERC